MLNVLYIQNIISNPARNFKAYPNSLKYCILKTLENSALINAGKLYIKFSIVFIDIN